MNNFMLLTFADLGLGLDVQWGENSIYYYYISIRSPDFRWIWRMAILIYGCPTRFMLYAATLLFIENEGRGLLNLDGLYFTKFKLLHELRLLAKSRNA